MKTKSKRYVFGPVPSRRLGRSLGVDLVPYKTCSLDCIYCQLGRTTKKTAEQAEYAPTSEVISQLESHLEKGPAPDVITLSGSGEPTLHKHFGEIIKRSKQVSGLPVAVLTNSSLLDRPEVQEDLMEADIVVPDLDAGDEDLFGIINRPCSEISFDRMVSGLKSFSKDYQGRLMLEVFLLGGINAMESEAKKIAGLIKGIRVSDVQLNTVARPPVEEFAMKVPRKRLVELAEMFDPPAEIVADFQGTEEPLPGWEVQEGDILEMLARRPCTLDDISAGLGINRISVVKYLEELLAKEEVAVSRQGSEAYYRLGDPGK